MSIIRSFGITLAAASLLVAACSPAAGPSATSAAPTAAPTPSPSPSPAKYGKIATIDVPGMTVSFDFTALDTATKTLYLADRTTNGVDIISLANEKYVSTITGFVGVRKSDDSGPNGLKLIPELKQLWATDGDSTVKVIDLTTNKVIDTIKTGGKKRGDDLGYDPKDKIVMVANDGEDPPFLTFISTTDRKILGKLPMPGAGGLEGMLWDDTKGVFWQSVPTSKANPGGELDLVDPKAMKVTQVYPVQNCYPHGIAFGPSNQLVLGCSGDAIAAGAKAQTLIMDKTNGSIVATVPEAGGSDIVWYNSGDNHYYLAGSNMTSDGTKAGQPAPALQIIDAATNKFIQGLPTKKSAHAVAVDPATNHIYVPIPNEGIAVFALSR